MWVRTVFKLLLLLGDAALGATLVGVSTDCPVEGCPTSGQGENGETFYLTVSGGSFTGAIEPLVTIGAASCPLVSISAVELVCLIPAGIGTWPVVVHPGDMSGLISGPNVRYAIPVILSVTGCAGGGTNGCETEDTLTITGRHFGSQGVWFGGKVFVGSKECLSQHDTEFPDRIITCTLDHDVGAGEQLSLRVRQYNGFFSDPATDPVLTFRGCTRDNYGAISESQPCTSCYGQLQLVVDDAGNQLNDTALATARARGEVTRQVCVPCPAGHVPSFGEGCAPCEAGRFAMDVATFTCSGCPAGSYSGEGASACTLCSAGSFSEDASPSCTLCGPGFHQPQSGEATCLVCPPGSFSDSLGRTSCASCGPGQVSDRGASACTKCGAGKVAAEGYGTGSGSCVPCAAGSFSEDGWPQCLPCPPGTVSHEGARACDKCPIGRSTEGQSNHSWPCLVCGDGTFASVAGQPNCTECPRGSYRTKDDALGREMSGARCILCIYGTFQPNRGQSSCVTPELGFDAVGMGQSEATPCPYGFASQLDGPVNMFQCLRCAMATHPASLNSTDMVLSGGARCVACEAGRHADPRDIGVCAPCPRGRWSAAGMEECTTCPVGKAQPLAGQAGCLQCDEGKFSRRPGSASCQACPPGQYQPLREGTNCETCPYGHFQDKHGQMNCTGCRPGTVAPLRGAAQCDICAAGRYAEEETMTECTACSAGFFSPGTRPCEKCPIGRFTPYSSQSKCERCSPGTARNETGTTSCALCEAGTFSENDGESVCTPCEKGYVQPFQGRSQCTGCPTGTFANSTGLLSCSECPAGSFTDQVGSAACVPCVAGRFNRFPKQSQCLDCPAGSVSPEQAAVSCAACEPGRINPGAGKVQCSLCAKGRYLTSKSGTACLECREGRTTASEGSAVPCILCEPGTYASTAASAACEKCKPGRFTDRWEASACTDCPQGRFSENGGTNCTICDPGKVAEKPGLTQCVPCEPGSASTDGVTCTPCELGFNASEAGSSACLPCPPGTKGGEQGIVCDACLPGEKSSASLIECEKCPPGTFSLGTAAECLDCAAGRVQPADGQDECEPCSTGRYIDTPGGTTCEHCPVGRFSVRNASDACEACPAGTSKELSTVVTCEPCARGRAVAESGMAECAQCFPNQIAPTTGQLLCFTCPGIANDERTACKCEVGEYATLLETGLVTCTRCPEGAACERDDVTYDTLEAAPGWWRSSPDSLEFLRCLEADHCLGGRNMSSLCAKFRKGALCSECIDGYSSATVLSPCEKCLDQGVSLGLTILFGCCVVVVLSVMFWVIIRIDHELIDEINKRFEYDKLWAGDDASTIAFGQPPGRPKTALQLGTVPKVQDGTRGQKPSIMFKMKILVGFLQILNNVAVNLVDVPWPSYFQAFVGYLSFVNLEFVPWQALDCAVPMNSYGKSIVVVLTPLGMVLTTLLVAKIDYWRMTHCSKAMAEVDRRHVMKLRRRLLWRTILFMMFLIYPSVSANIFSMFLCTKINSTYYLRSDFTLHCYDDAWMRHLILVIPGIILMPIGFPVVFLYILNKYRRKTTEENGTVVNRLRSLEVKLQIGFLYAAYTPKYWWWEAVDMMHKLLLSSVVPFVPFEWQLPFAMIIVGVYLLLLLINHPYVRRSDSAMHSLVQVELLLFLLAGHLALSQGLRSLDLVTDVALSILFIALTLLLLALFAFMFMQSMIRACLKHRARTSKKKRKSKIGLDFGPSSRTLTKGPSMNLISPLANTPGMDLNGRPKNVRQLSLRRQESHGRFTDEDEAGGERSAADARASAAALPSQPPGIRRQGSALLQAAFLLKDGEADPPQAYDKAQPEGPRSPMQQRPAVAATAAAGASSE